MQPEPVLYLPIIACIFFQYMRKDLLCCTKISLCKFFPSFPLVVPMAVRLSPQSYYLKAFMSPERLKDVKKVIWLMILQSVTKFWDKVY